MAASSSTSLAQLAAVCEADGLTVQNSEKIALALAAEFKVRVEEVGILRVEKDSLVFVHPAKLHKVGKIPLNNSSSVAVHTLNTKRAEILNAFAKAKHTTFFEMVNLSDKTPGSQAGRENQTIQKLMTAPVINVGKAVGVIQICRKGATLIRAGADFSSSDLQRLVGVTVTLAKCFK
jgi:hypothetical protein